jgi:hypothetical protein
MSNYFQGVTFADQNVTPSDDGQLHRAMLPDGILSGCAFYTSGTTLTMGVGSLMLCGRQVRHSAEQSWNISGATSGYARLVLTVDLSRSSTEDAFDQVNDSIEYAASLAGFPELETSDINSAGVRYQAAVCTVLLSASGISGFVQNLPRFSSACVYAPAGYGPGQNEVDRVQSLAALDGLTTTGVFGILLPLSESYVGGVDIRMSTVAVEAYDANTTLQTVSVIGTPAKLLRWRTNGAWAPWSVQNPPMALGEEYRTTEQWNGLPVYTKRLAFSASGFSSQNVSFAHGIENLDVCISADVLWKRTDTAGAGWRHLPASEYTTGALDGQIEDVTADQIKFRLGSELQYRMKQSTEPVYVTLRYTKA